MHGLIFVTCEKYLSERFKGSILKEYRDALGETPASAPLTSRVYDDEALLAGVEVVNHITGVPIETLLREFGRYFLVNGLTRRLCAYILTQVQNGRDLLLAMHDAHQQMARLPDGLTPPLFEYRTWFDNPDELTLIYDSPRKLCPVLIGAIEGAAERYGEQVYIIEQTRMKRGDPVCRFDIRFSASSTERLETAEQMQRHQAKQQFAQFILSSLPDEGGVTLAELQEILLSKGVSKALARPALLLEALQHLHHAGLVATTANQPGDNLAHRRYWRISTSDKPLWNTRALDRTERAHQRFQRPFADVEDAMVKREAQIAS